MESWELKGETRRERIKAPKMDQWMGFQPSSVQKGNLAAHATLMMCGVSSSGNWAQPLGWDTDTHCVMSMLLPGSLVG